MPEVVLMDCEQLPIPLPPGEHWHQFTHDPDEAELKWREWGEEEGKRLIVNAAMQNVLDNARARLARWAALS